MSSSESDRNLLTGILALQLSLITQQQLITAMQEWVFSKSLRLEDILLKNGALTSASKLTLAQMVEQYLSLHNHDASKGLGALPVSPGVREELLTVNDVSVNATIGSLPQGGSSDAGLLETIVGDRNVSETGRFRILRPHARGGLGIVSIAEDCQVHREVALKQIQSPHHKSTEHRSRFLVEAEITGRLEHPGIVPVYSMGHTEKGEPFYAMRLIRGENMKAAIQNLHSSPPDFRKDQDLRQLRQLVRRLVDVCNAVAYAHSRGVIHRDIKPTNIMIGKFGETLLVDWGLARARSRDNSKQVSDEATVVPLSADSSSQTRMGTVVGTLTFMSPEQAEGRQDLMGPRSDIYSLGATLYCVMTGNSPMEGLASDEIISALRAGRIANPLQRNSSIPPALAAVCMKAMDKDPDMRFSSADELAEELERWIADDAVQCYQEPLLVRFSRWTRKHRVAVATTLGVLFATAVASSVGTVIVRREQQKTQIERDDAIRQRDLANQNLAVARDLAMAMLDASEKQLATGVPTRQLMVDTRALLTELAFEKFGALYDANPGDQAFRFEYAKSARVSGNLQRTKAQFTTSAERVQLSLTLQEMTPEEARSADEWNYLSETYRERATNQFLDGKLSLALDDLKHADEIADRLIKQDPNQTDFIRLKALDDIVRAQIALERHEFELVDELSRRNIERFSMLASCAKPHPVDRTMEYFAHCHRIDGLIEAKKYTDAITDSQRTLELLRADEQKTPNDPHLPTAVLECLILRFQAQIASDPQATLDEAEAEDFRVRSEKAKSFSLSAAALRRHANYQCQLAESLRRQGKLDDATKAVADANQTATMLLAASKMHEHYLLMFRVQQAKAKLAESYGDNETAPKEHEAAATSIKAALQICPDSKRYAGLLDESENE